MKQILFILAALSLVSAQQWSGIIDPARAIDWTTAGVMGGIPSRSTICQTLTSSATAAQINSAITNCAAAHTSDAGGIVVLSAGNYSLNTGIDMKSNVTLRGAGANQTKLTFTGVGSYHWGSYGIGVIGNYDQTFDNGQPPGPGGADPSKTRTWTGTNGVSGTFTKGATVLNLASAPTGLLVGDMLQLVQNDDSTTSSGLFVCSNTNNGCSREGSANTYGTGQRQNVKVTAINGSQVTISPGIYMSNWRTSQSPRGYWWGGDMRAVGIEDLSVTLSAVAWGAVVFFEASDSWASGVGVHVINGCRNGFHIRLSRNITIQNGWVDPMSGGGFNSTTSYGIETYGATATLLLNNIFKNVESPIIPDAGSAGGVIAYNYDNAPDASGAGIQAHEIGFQMALMEGNQMKRFRNDTYHGTQNFGTTFRNRFDGTGEPSIDTWSYNRYNNHIGNVLGPTGGQANRYECITPDSSGQCSRFASPSVIFRFGFAGANAGAGPEAGVANDSIVATSAMRWGNYDTVNAANRFNCSEVPTAEPNFPNACPASQTLPASFFYSAKPAWWPGSKPWPAIGPDVSGGSIAGLNGHAYTIPAVDCYNSVSGSFANFNAATCYPSISSGPTTGVQGTVTIKGNIVTQ